jgi:hypothetical protein
VGVVTPHPRSGSEGREVRPEGRRKNGSTNGKKAKIKAKPNGNSTGGRQGEGEKKGQ